MATYKIGITEPKSVEDKKTYERYDDALNALEELMESNDDYTEGIILERETMKIVHKASKGMDDNSTECDEMECDTPIIKMNAEWSEEDIKAAEQATEEKVEESEEEEQNSTDDNDELYEMYKPLADYLTEHLGKRAEEDSQFSVTYAKENKSIKECLRYIVGEAKKTCKRSGNYGMQYYSPDTVVSMAIHYYDEDDIKVDENWTKAKPFTPYSKASNKPSTPSAPSITPPPSKPVTPREKTAKEKAKEKKEKAQAAVISMFDDSFFD